MPELKHGFGAAKMNKDADERIVPNGEYRDALNIEIVTSEGSDVGSMQTLLGNTEITNSTMPSDLISFTARCVGSIADEQNNHLYYLVADPDNYTDYILQYNSNTDTITPIVVDKYKVEADVSVAISSNAGGVITHFLVDEGVGGATGNITNIRPGMLVTASTTLGVGGNQNSFIIPSDGYFVLKMKRCPSFPGISALNHPGNWEVYLDQSTSTSTLFTLGMNSNIGSVMFHAKRVLNFSSFDLNSNLTFPFITGINIIDGILFWTDGKTEPKKIIIENFTKDTLAGKQGTHSSGELHSFFNVYAHNLIDPVNFNPNGLVIFESNSGNAIDLRTQPIALEEEHITIIKKPPLHPPTLVLSNTSDNRFQGIGPATLTGEMTEYFIDYDNGHNLPVGTVKDIFFTGPPPDYIVGDLILLRKDDPFTSSDLDNFELIVEILEYDSSVNGNAKVKISFIQNDPVNLLTPTGIPPNTDPPPVATIFHSMLQQEKPLYEFKLPKFAFRYKYQDNQYSTYSPFSEVAFLPGDFDYYPKDGYNIGMVNTLRSVHVMDFVTDIEAIPKDVIEIDILYKESNSTNIYLIKTVKIDETEWLNKGSVINTAGYPGARTKGRIQITSEMVRSAIASNQLLRPWDNVPRTAKAQEIVGNRIVYANYLQNYNL